MKSRPSWFGKHKILTGALILAIIVIASAYAGRNSSKTNSATTANAGKPKTSTTSGQSTHTSTVRKVTGTTVTLGAGTFTGGTDVAPGLYNVTPGPGQSGNFIVSGTDTYNEILGVNSGIGVPSVRAQISKGDQIQISGLSNVTFTPVTSPYITTHSAVTLGAGTWIVGQDIGAGRYIARPASGQSGNFMVSGADYYNEILGTNSTYGEVPNLTVNLSDGDTILISGMYGVTMTPIS